VKLAGRLVLAGLLAAGGILLLLWLGRDRAPESPAPDPFAAADRAAAQRATLLATLHGRADRILLARDERSLPPDAAPVLAIRGGLLSLPRAPPAPGGPELPRWPAAAILLPAPLGELQPDARAALLEAIGRLSGAGMQIRIDALDFALDPVELARLRRWQR
jgi:hypothetical protein